MLVDTMDTRDMDMSVGGHVRLPWVTRTSYRRDMYILPGRHAPLVDRYVSPGW